MRLCRILRASSLLHVLSVPLTLMLSGLRSDILRNYDDLEKKSDVCKEMIASVDVDKADEVQRKVADNLKAESSDGADKR